MHMLEEEIIHYRLKNVIKLDIDVDSNYGFLLHIHGIMSVSELYKRITIQHNATIK